VRYCCASVLARPLIYYDRLRFLFCFPGGTPTACFTGANFIETDLTGSDFSRLWRYELKDAQGLESCHPRVPNWDDPNCPFDNFVVAKGCRSQTVILVRTCC
jgi:hypothetical protein